ncbi:hypothetical protein [Herbaspirillum huttiense]|uniref:Uncharacterized protein n=2 Tax=Herbaspirillum huttiense TaxID=863372 RepID=A0AAJ2LT02_9BURK|nr:MULTISPECIES: hypothetical protein [Herbaspirillum]MDR9834361.1 hypothetical protein [Herbaspirillum huttiense]UWE18620.1 hypothetical protein NY669_10765 [Herbaspirillum huttiense]
MPETALAGRFLLFGTFFLAATAIFLKFLELPSKKDLLGVSKHAVLVRKALKKIFCKSPKLFPRLPDKAINRG